MTFYSKQIVKDLVYNYDIRQGKTVKRTKVFSLIPDEYKLSFICGYFDGDGSVGAYGKNKKLSISISAYSRKVLDGFQKWLLMNYNLYCPIYPVYKIDKETGEIRVYYDFRANNVESVSLFSRLYMSKENELPLMKRKLKIFKTYS
jgi:hypothetical protein